MIKAGFLKEYLYFSRTKKMLGLIITYIAFALVDALLMRGVLYFAETIPQEMVNANNDISISTGSTEIVDSLTNIDNNASIGVMGAIGDLTNTVSLILMLVLMQAAGGELKKRATILPDCAGLTPKAYLVPKFFLYPAFTFLMTFLSVMVCYAFSSIIFTESFPIGNALLAGICAGGYTMFINGLYLCIGLSAARPGVSVAVCYGGASILGVLLPALGAEKFHPLALLSIAQSVVAGEIDGINIFGSLAVSILLIAALYLVTLMVLSAKKIDNMGQDTGRL